MSGDLERMPSLADVPALIRRERRELAELVEPEDLAVAEHRAAAIAELTRRAGLAVPVQNEAMLLRAEALERLAAVVGEAQKNGEVAKRGSSNQYARSDARTLHELKLDKRRLAEGRALAETDVLDRARADAERRPDKPLRWNDLVVRAQRLRRLDANVKERKRLEQAARLERVRLEALGEQPFLLEHGDVHEWRPPQLVQAIVTDPPYVTDDALGLYNALADFALEALEPGGVLAVMVWPPMLTDVVEAFADRWDLVYRWSIVWHFTTHDNTANHQRRVFDTTKLVLIYHRGEMPADASYFIDYIESPDADKDIHHWQQSLTGFEWLVQRLVRPGATVCDPFVGSGTTAVAALRNQCRFVGCDIDPAAVRIARERLEP